MDEAFLHAFTMPKGRNQGASAVFDIKYIDAAIDEAAFAVEFFIEFTSLVWQHKLLARLEELGAGSVYVGTFGNNDQNESAAASLVRVWAAAAKGKAYQRGVCTPALLVKAHAKQHAEGMSQADFDAKTAQMVVDSVDRLGEQLSEGLSGTTEGLAAVSGDVDRMAVEVGELRITVASWDQITRDNERLRAQLQHKTLLADRVEHSKGLITQEKNVFAARAAEAERKAAQAADALAYERMLSAGVTRENDMFRAQNDMLRTQVQDLRTQVQHLYATNHTFADMARFLGQQPRQPPSHDAE